MTKLRLYDNTRISAFRSCQRYFYYRHVRDWSGEGTAPALAFGAAWHSAMDVVWAMAGAHEKILVTPAFNAFVQKWTSEGMPHPDELDNESLLALGARTPMVALEMLYEYIEARGHLFLDPSFKLLSIEQPFAVPLDPTDPTLFYVGRLDKVYEFQGEIIVGEHKTTSLYKKEGPFLSSFTDSFSPNSQIDGYLYAAHMLYGDKVKRVMVDAALVHKTVHDGFRLIPIERQFSQLEAWLWETRNYISAIESNKQTLSYLIDAEEEPGPYLAAFPKNTSACTNFGNCTFLDLCKMWSNPEQHDEPMGYKTNKWSPFDELGLEKLGMKKEDTSE